MKKIIQLLKTEINLLTQELSVKQKLIFETNDNCRRQERKILSGTHIGITLKPELPQDQSRQENNIRCIRDMERNMPEFCKFVYPAVHNME